MTTPKIIRGQLRQIVQEILPSLLESEFGKQIYTRISKVVNENLADIKGSVEAHLNEMNERSKAMQAYVERQVQAELDRNKTPRATIDPTASTQDPDQMLLVSEDGVTLL